ncbi:MAG: hypothetical protein IVW56_09485 [Candidatus Binataceae bacterium]|nr:hypothetical protein [Candidatus Binataceae bacterium]
MSAGFPRLSPVEAAIYGTPEARARDRAPIMRKPSYGMALLFTLLRSVRRAGPDALEIDKLRFVMVDGGDTSNGLTLRHTRLFRLDGTGQTYRLIVEPVPETHR